LTESPGTVKKAGNPLKFARSFLQSRSVLQSRNPAILQLP
jgi:hypothetical protein